VGFGGVEFFAEFGDDSVVDGVGLAVVFNPQFSGDRIGAEGDGGFHEATDEAAGVVRAAQGFSCEVDQRGFAAVGEAGLTRRVVSGRGLVPCSTRRSSPWCWRMYLKEFS